MFRRLYIKAQLFILTRANQSATSHCAAFHSSSREQPHGKNKTLAQIIVAILVSHLMALLFSQRCPKLLERKAD